jgi:type II secretory pathway pseudopilin PulG
MTFKPTMPKPRASDRRLLTLPPVAGTSRCDVPARVQRAERSGKVLRAFDCAAERGADGAARRPYLNHEAVSRCAPSDRRRRGFTLVEALVAILFMAIVIPVALGAMRVASMAGEAGQRKLVAARIANKVLNELKVENLLQSAGQNGLVQENGASYKWSETSQVWTQDPVSRLTLATVSVDYSVSGCPCNVQLSTLAPEPGQ